MQAEKLAIRTAFGRAAHSYDAVARLQRRIADRLIAMSEPGVRDLVLDAGCGTGYGARKLMEAGTVGEKNIRCIALDIAMEMAAYANGNSLCGDIEALPLPSDCINLYWSSLAWQWIDPQRAIAEAARVMRSGGKLRVATLGPQTLHELRTAFARADNALHVRRFTPAHCYRRWLEDAGFSDCEIQHEPTTVFVADLRTLLHELKALGAHVIGENRPRGLLGRHAWHRIVARYETQRTAQGLPATYDVIYLSATKSL